MEFKQDFKNILETVYFKRTGLYTHDFYDKNRKIKIEIHKKEENYNLMSKKPGTRFNTMTYSNVECGSWYKNHKLKNIWLTQHF